MTRHVHDEATGPRKLDEDDVVDDPLDSLDHRILHLFQVDDRGATDTDIPKLADAGLVTFVADTDTIELAGSNGHGHLIDEAARIDDCAKPASDD